YDKAGNIEAAPGSPDDSTTIDTQEPTSLASSPTYSTSTAVTVTYTASDPDKNGFNSGLDKVELYAHTPGIAGYALAGTDTSPDVTQSFAFTGTVDGVYDFYTVAYDKAGNIEAAPGSPDDSTTIDTQKPTSMASSPTATNSATFSVSYTTSDPNKNGVNSGLDVVELWAKAPGDLTYSLYATDAAPGASGTFAYIAVAGEGGYDFYTIDVEKAGNREAVPLAPDDVTVVADTSRILDQSPPSSTASAPTYSTTTSVTAPYTATDAGSPPSGLDKVELYAHTPGIAGYALAGTDT